MFLKPYKLKSNAPLKSSDAKKLRQRIQNEFPNINPDLLIPPKSSVNTLKLVTHGDFQTNVYCADKMPMFFENEDNKLVPTLYSLRQIPDLLPYFTTHASVLPKLSNGADLMLPGVTPQVIGMNMYGHHKKGQLVGVNLTSNSSAVGVGYLPRSSDDLYMCGGHGVAVKMLHLFGDKLWAHEPSLAQQVPQFKSTKLTENDFPALGSNLKASTKPSEETLKTHLMEINENFLSLGSNSRANNTTAEEPTEDETLKSEVLIKNDELPTSEIENIKISNEHEETDVAIVAEVILKQAFLSALKNHGKTLQLPLLTSNFFRLYVVPEAQQPLNLKKTKYKKLSNFLNEMIDQGFLEVREVTKGVDKITSIDLEHPELINFITDYKKPTATDGSVETPLFHSELTKLYTVNDITAPLFTKFNYKRGESIAASKIKKVIREYVNKQNLTVSKDPLAGDKLYVLDECLEKICNFKQATLRRINNTVIWQMHYSYQMCNVKDVKSNKPKCVEINENFLSLGSNSRANNTTAEEPTEDETLKSEVLIKNDELPTSEIENIKISNEHEETDVAIAAEVILKQAFLSALKNHGKTLQLPLLTSNFFRLYVVPEAQQPLNLKKTKYKKLSNFLNEMIDQGFLEVREVTKGVDKITSIDLEHPELINFITDYKKPTATDGSVETPLFHSELTKLYTVNDITAPLFTKFNYKRGESIAASKIKKVIREYVNKQNLTVSKDPLAGDKLYVLDECLEKICNFKQATLRRINNAVIWQMHYSYQMCNVKDVKSNKPKCVEINENFLSLGSNSRANNTTAEEPTQDETLKSEVLIKNDELPTSEIENIKISNEHEETDVAIAAEVILKQAFLSALKNHGKTLQLPLLTSNFFRLYVVPEAQQPLDLKKTKYKKLSNFLNEMIDQGFLEVREVTKGVDKITSIDLEHPELINFITDYKKPTATDGSAETPLFHSELTELYTVTDITAPLFTKLYYKRGESIAASKIKKVIREYVNKQNLTVSKDPLAGDKLYVLDECLEKICNFKQATLSRINNAVISQMDHSYQMCNVKDVKSNKPMIQMSLATRLHNKKVTLVSNIECYGIILAEFIKLCKQGAAASTTIVTLPNQNRKMIQIQGNQVLFLYKLLTETYKIPLKCILGLELAKDVKKHKRYKKKKKKKNYKKKWFCFALKRIAARAYSCFKVYTFFI